MYVIVILKTNLLTLFSKRRPFNISDGKGKGNTSENRDKNKGKKVKNKKPCDPHGQQGKQIKLIFDTYELYDFKTRRKLSTIINMID